MEVAPKSLKLSAMISARLFRLSFVASGLVVGVLACHGATSFNGETVVGLQTAAPPPPPAPVDAGAPPPAPHHVEVKGNKVEIDEKIQFEVNKSTIKAESNGLLDEIAQVIKANPIIKKILVEGHSSSEGDPKANLKLSDDRAKAVVAALESRGVAKGILTAKGFGSSDPIDKGNTEEAREKNRRVEFTIQDPKSGASDAGAPTTMKDGGK